MQTKAPFACDAMQCKVQFRITRSREQQYTEFEARKYSKEQRTYHSLSLIMKRDGERERVFDTRRTLNEIFKYRKLWRLEQQMKLIVIKLVRAAGILHVYLKEAAECPSQCNKQSTS